LEQVKCAMTKKKNPEIFDEYKCLLEGEWGAGPLSSPNKGTPNMLWWGGETEKAVYTESPTYQYGKNVRGSERYAGGGK